VFPARTSRIVLIAAALATTLTTGASAAIVRHAGPAFAKYGVVNAGSHGPRSASCSHETASCLSPTRNSPFVAEWCISSSGNCSSGLVGNWNWTATVTKVGRGKGYKRVKASWSPDPGNPSVITISDSRRKAKGKKTIANVTLSTCNTSSGSCFSNFAIYCITN
jgi:hypothetical protein